MKDGAQPSHSADEVVFRPSGKVYSRKPQIVLGKRAAPEFDLLTLDAQVLADAAQIYADFSRKEVRVPRALVDRPMSFADGVSQVAAGYAIQTLDSKLSHDGVNVVAISRSVVAFRAGRNFQEQIADRLSPPATPAEIAAALAAMSLDRFWQLIETATGKGRHNSPRSALALQKALVRLRPEEIFGFQLRFQERLAESYRWDIWAVAYIVNGGASDDGFEYFRCWLIAQGREYFQAAIANPVRAADRAGRHQQNESEQILYAALQAYQTKTNKLPPTVPPSGNGHPIGTSWEEKDLPNLYPELVKRFR